MPQVKAVTHLSTHTPQIKAVYTRNSLWSTCLHTHITTAFDPHVYTHKNHTLQPGHTYTSQAFDPPVHTSTNHTLQFMSTCSHTSQPVIHLFTHITVSDPPVHTYYSQWSMCSHTSQSVIHLFTHIHTHSTACDHHLFTHNPTLQTTYVFTHTHKLHTEACDPHVHTHTHTGDPPVHTHKPYNTTCSSSCNQ